MTHSTVWQNAGRVLFILLAMVLVASFVSAQDLILNGDQTNNGLIRVRRDVINNTTGLVTVSGTGIVRLDRNVTPHAIKSASGTYPITFSNLDMIQGMATTCQVDVTVTNQIRFGNGATNYTADFDIGTRTLTISNLSSYMATSSGNLIFNSGTVAFNSGSAQSILNNAAGVTYGTLSISGAGAKDVTTGGTVTAASLTQAGGQLSVTENVDVTGSGSFFDLGAISATKRLRMVSGATSGSVTAIDNTGTGTFENAANIALAIATLTSNSGTIQNSGTGSIAFTNPAASNGTITNTSTGTIDFNNDLTGTGTVSQTAAGTMEIGGAFTQNTYSLGNGTVVYNSGAAGQSIVGTTYNNLTLNIASKTLAGVATINGDMTLDASSALDMNNNNISLTGNLVLGSNVTTGNSGVLTMTSTTAANVSGAGEVLGAVRRNHNFTSGQNYLFNRTDVYLGTATTAGTDITLRVSAATDPGGTLPSTKYVSRNYAITAPTAGNLEAIRLHYEVGELQGSITDTKIGLRSYNGAAWSKVTNAGQTRTSGGANTYMTYSNLNNALPASGELGMFGIDFRTIANGADISNAAGWDENAVPTSSDDAIIAHTGIVTGASPVSVDNLTINAGTDLTTNNAAGTLTVATSTTVDGTLNITTANADVAAISVGSAGVVSVAGGRTLTGTSFTNSSSNASTFTGNVSLSSLANNGTGILNFNGNGSSISGAITNAAGAAISVGGTLNMMTSAALSLSSDGDITVSGATGILNIGKSSVPGPAAASNLTMSGNSTLTLDNAAGQLNVFGNLEIGATATLDNSGEITVGE